MTTTAIPGIVLAAGASTRMGRPKALLTVSPSGESFVQRIVATLVTSGVAPIVVVTRKDLEPALRDAVSAATIVVNDDPSRGQLSSLLAGLEALTNPTAVLVTLVDLPFVRARTVCALIETWRTTGAPVVRPVHGGRHGHPAIFGAAVLDGLRGAELSSGAKPVLSRFLSSAVDVPVDDAGTVEDVDTPEAYRRLVAPPLHDS